MHHNVAMFSKQSVIFSVFMISHLRFIAITLYFLIHSFKGKQKKNIKEKLQRNFIAFIIRIISSIGHCCFFFLILLLLLFVDIISSYLFNELLFKFFILTSIRSYSAAASLYVLSSLSLKSFEFFPLPGVQAAAAQLVLRNLPLVIALIDL